MQDIESDTLAEIRRIEREQERREHEQSLYVASTSRNQRRLEKKKLLKQIKKHMKGLR